MAMRNSPRGTLFADAKRTRYLPAPHIRHLAPLESPFWRCVTRLGGLSLRTLREQRHQKQKVAPVLSASIALNESPTASVRMPKPPIAVGRSSPISEHCLQLKLSQPHHGALLPRKKSMHGALMPPEKAHAARKARSLQPHQRALPLTEATIHQRALPPAHSIYCMLPGRYIQSIAFNLLRSTTTRAIATAAKTGLPTSKSAQPPSMAQSSLRQPIRGILHRTTRRRPGLLDDPRASDAIDHSTRHHVRKNRQWYCDTTSEGHIVRNLYGQPAMDRRRD